MIQSLQRWHLFVCILIASSWFMLGAWKGWGYCLVTDLQWRVLRQLGQTDLPDSYMPLLYRYLSGRVGNVQRIDRITQLVFYCLCIVSLIVNWDYLRNFF